MALRVGSVYPFGQRKALIKSGHYEADMACRRRYSKTIKKNRKKHGLLRDRAAGKRYGPMQGCFARILSNQASIKRLVHGGLPPAPAAPGTSCHDSTPNMAFCANDDSRCVPNVARCSTNNLIAARHRAITQPPCKRRTQQPVQTIRNSAVASPYSGPADRRPGSHVTPSLAPSTTKVHYPTSIHPPSPSQSIHSNHSPLFFTFGLSL